MPRRRVPQRDLPRARHKQPKFARSSTTGGQAGGDRSVSGTFRRPFRLLHCGQFVRLSFGYCHNKRPSSRR